MGLTCSHSGQWGGGGNVAMRHAGLTEKAYFGKNSPCRAFRIISIMCLLKREVLTKSAAQREPAAFRGH